MQIEEGKRLPIETTENLRFPTPQQVIDFFVNTASDIVNGEIQLKFSKFNLFLLYERSFLARFITRHS